MNNQEKKQSVFYKLFSVFIALFISGIVAKIVYVLYSLCLLALIKAGPTMSFIIFITGLGLSIFSWVMCFKWLYGYLKKELFSI